MPQDKLFKESFPIILTLILLFHFVVVVVVLLSLHLVISLVHSQVVLIRLRVSSVTLLNHAWLKKIKAWCFITYDSQAHFPKIKV